MQEPFAQLSRDLVEIRSRKEDPQKTIELIIEKNFDFYKEYPDIHHLVTEIKVSEDAGLDLLLWGMKKR